MTTLSGKGQHLAAVLFCLVLAADCTRAAEPVPALHIDGKTDDAAWKKARPIEAFQTFKGEQPKAATTGWLLTDTNFLYLAFRCDEPMMEKLQASAFPRDGGLWTNDCLEIFIAPFQRTDNFYHLIVDVNAQIYDALNRAGKEDPAYDLFVTAATQKEAAGWTCEMAIPLADIGLSPARNALMNFGRERKPMSENTAWHGLFAKPETWQQMPLTLDKRYIADVQDWSLGGDAPQYGRNDLKLELSSARSADSLKALVLVQQKGEKSWQLKSSTLLPRTMQKTTPITLPYSLAPQDKLQSMRFVLEHDGQPIFRTTYQLSLPAQALSTTLNVPYYYAEENAGLIRLETFLSPQSLKTSALRLTVKTPGGKVQQVKTIRALRKNMTLGFDISAWRAGRGQLVAELISDNKLLARRQLPIIKRPGPFSQLALKPTSK